MSSGRTSDLSIRRSLAFTLTGPADLGGKRLELTDENSASAFYYSNLTLSSIQEDSVTSGYRPIFPAATYLAGTTRGDYLWFENDSSSSVDVVLSPVPIVCTPCRGMPTPPSKKITIPPGVLYLAQYNYSP